MDTVSQVWVSETSELLFVTNCHQLLLHSHTSPGTRMPEVKSCTGYMCKAVCCPVVSVYSGDLDSICPSRCGRCIAQGDRSHHPCCASSISSNLGYCIYDLSDLHLKLTQAVHKHQAARFTRSVIRRLAISVKHSLITKECLWSSPTVPCQFNNYPQWMTIPIIRKT